MAKKSRKPARIDIDDLIGDIHNHLSKNVLVILDKEPDKNKPPVESETPAEMEQDK